MSTIILICVSLFAAVYFGLYLWLLLSEHNRKIESDKMYWKLIQDLENEERDN